MKKKIGFIGTGFIAQTCHLPNYSQINDVKIMAICDENIKIANSVAKKYKVKKIYQNYKDLLKKENNLDAIVLTVPRHKTFEISKEILKNKINLFSEKPMALSTKSALTLSKLAEKNNLIYMIGHMKRHDESIKYLKKLFKYKDFNFKSLQSVYYESFAGDSFGKLKKFIKKNKSYKSHYINSEVMKNKVPIKNKIKYLKFLNTHSHAINLLRYLFGEINIKFNYLKNNEERMIILEKNNKILILNTRKIFSNDWHENLIINFNKYKISLNFPMPMMVKQPNRLSILNIINSKDNKIKLKKTWSFKNQSIEFVKSLSDKTKNICKGKDCINDIKLIEQIFS